MGAAPSNGYGFVSAMIRDDGLIKLTLNVGGGQVVGQVAHGRELVGRGRNAVFLCVDCLQRHEVSAVGHGEVSRQSEMCHLQRKY